MCHSARDENGINMATKHGPFCGNILGNVVNHGINNKFGMLIAILDASQNLAHVVRSQMGVETCLASNALQELLLIILAAKAETYQIDCRKAACAFRRKRAFTVKGIVGINGLAVVMGCYANTTSQMTDDEAQVLVLLADASGIATGNGALVECVPDGNAWHEW